jgi:hypothetical protein
MEHLNHGGWNEWILSRVNANRKFLLVLSTENEEKVHSPLKTQPCSSPFRFLGIAVREDDIAALVDGAGFQFAAGATDGEGVDAAAAITGRRFANRSTISESGGVQPIGHATYLSR